MVQAHIAVVLSAINTTNLIAMFVSSYLRRSGIEVLKVFVLLKPVY